MSSIQLLSLSHLFLYWSDFSEVAMKAAIMPGETPPDGFGIVSTVLTKRKLMISPAQGANEEIATISSSEAEVDKATSSVIKNTHGQSEESC